MVLLKIYPGLKKLRLSLRACIVTVVLSLMLCCNSILAQDLENIVKQRGIDVTGGVSANTTFYSAQGIPNRRDPFYWMLNANLNFNILGIIQAPFSMTLSEQNKNFSQPQPFNRFGISPKYKTVTTHFGYRTMNFSEYTLAGNMFLGAGVDIVPKNGFIRFSAMYGRLAKAIDKSAQSGLVFVQPTYRRMGYGLKLGLGRKKNMMDFIFFKAADDVNSVVITEKVDVKPEENLVAAVHGKNELSDRVIVEYEYAYSFFTHDKRSIETTSDSFSFIDNLGGLFKPNISSEFNRAFTGIVNYNGQSYQANIKYRKIDPGYRTLGSSFLNNGMKDLTGGLSWGMFRKKITISTNAGVQQSAKENSVLRVIYACNVNYVAGERFTISSTYSNFSTTTRQTQIQRDKRFDSLEYFQVTRSGSAFLNYRLGGEKRSQTLTLSANLQDAKDNQHNSSTFYNLNIGQQMKIASQWQLGISGAYNRNNSALQVNTSYGPVININRSFLKGKVRSGCSGVWLNSFINETQQGEIMNVTMTNNFKVGKKHSLAANVYYLNNKDRSAQGKNFSEIRAMLNYGYSFR